MDEEAKLELARKLLHDNGYSDEEIAEILRYAFGDKKLPIEEPANAR